MAEPAGVLLLASSDAEVAFLRGLLPELGDPLAARSATGEDSARAALAEGRVAAALCDARRLPLPDAVRALDAEPDPVPLVLVAGDAAPEVVELALRRGASIHVAGSDAAPLAEAMRLARARYDARELRRRRASFDAGQRDILEMVGAGAPLAAILESIVLLVEAQASGLACSLLLLDAAEQKVRHGAAPSLPAAYVEAIDGSAIGPDAGSCGAAAYRGERVVVEDIATHPNWVAYRHLALPHGLRACWSTPILAPTRVVLGTFAIYYRQPRLPTAVEEGWVDAATHLAAVAILRDRAEQTVRSSELRFRQLVTTTHEGVLVVDREGKTTFANRRIAEMIGADAGEMEGRSLFDLVHPDDRDAVQARFARVRAGSREQSEVRIGRRDGSHLWAIVASSPLEGDDGEFAGALGMVTDVTEYRRVVSERLAREELLRVLFDNVSDVVFYIGVEPLLPTPDGGAPRHRYRFLSVNPAFVQATGLSQEQVLGRYVDEVVPEPSRSKVVASYERAVDSRSTVRWDEVTPYPAGVKHGEVAVTPVFDRHGRCTSLVGTVHDVTERINAQQRIASQAAIIDRASDAILLRGVEDGVVHYWNEGAAKLYGFTSAEAVGRRVTELIYRDTTALDRAQRRLLEQGLWSGELTQHAKDGRPITVRASWTLQRDAAGQPAQMIAINTDVTETKRLQTQVMLAQRMESLGTLAGGIAHDFNNILTAIIGNVELAMKHSPAGGVVRERLDVVRGACARATGLVGQILTFSRRREPRRTLTDLRPIVDETVKLLRATLPRRIEIDAALPADSLPVVADPSQIHQVVMNLATNGAQALGTAPGRVELRLEPVVVEASAPPGDVPAGRYMRLSVTDTGAGMDDATMARIFEPFFTTKEPGRGTGLGLSVVHGIVKSHEGAIKVTSRPGSGASFVVHLPAAAQQERSSLEAWRGHGERILYVDEKEAVAGLVVNVLEGLGYQAKGFVDPARALDAFAAEPGRFDLVVSDYELPGMSGIDVASAVHRIRPGVPVVVVASHVTPREEEAARTAGVSALLGTATFVEELPRTLRRLLAPRP